MQKLSVVLAVILVIGVILFVLWGGFIAFGLFLQASATVQLGAITALISVIAFLYNNHHQQNREIKSRQFAEKRQAYQKFFDLMFDIFDAQRTGTPLEDTVVIQRMGLVVKEIMVWGSADTINQYNAYMKTAQSTDSAEYGHAIKNMEALMRALRRDLGHNDRALDKLALSKLLIKADDHDKLDDV